jgi:NAD(P)-dependent dehydrogenase (short-subunit alcohol dehydrogenase family)
VKDNLQATKSSHLPDLTGKIALVTGGTTGIGRAAAELFHLAGARVVITGQSAVSLEATRRELPDSIIVIRADGRSVDDAGSLAAQLKARFGRLDIALLNAGVAQLAPFEAVDERHYAEQMDVNVKGAVFTLQKILPLMTAGGSVVFTTSVADAIGSPNLSIYAASKGAIAALMRSLAVELAGRQIRVNAISPGPTRTPIQDKFGLPADVRAAVEAQMSAKIPLGRYGESRELASAALFLASPAASFITGVELAVDGGLLAA